jgi:hypothetical protein
MSNNLVKNSFDLNNNDETFESLSNSNDSYNSDIRHKTKDDNVNHPLHGLSSTRYHSSFINNNLIKKNYLFYLKSRFNL